MVLSAMYPYLDFDETHGLAELDTDAFGDAGTPRQFPVLCRSVNEWCSNQLRGDYELEHEVSYGGAGIDSYFVRYNIVFDLEVDAMMFKLKWL